MIVVSFIVKTHTSFIRKYKLFTTKNSWKVGLSKELHGDDLYYSMNLRVFLFSMSIIRFIL